MKNLNDLDAIIACMLGLKAQGVTKDQVFDHVDLFLGDVHSVDDLYTARKAVYG